MTSETHKEDGPLAEEAVISKLDAFDELPDAPPKRRIKLSWVGKISVGVVVFWLLMIAIGPSIAPFHEMEMEGDFSAPSELKYVFGDEENPDDYASERNMFLLGTDYLGRDVLSRVLYGARNTLGISILATLLAYCMGITLGILAAVKGGWVDMCISRVIDAILAIPSIMLGLVAIAALGSSIPILIIVSSIIYATSVFRIARALGLDIMVQDYVEAAKARGEGVWWIIKSEILPNAAMPLATDFGLRLVFVVLFISTLSFLGLGVPPPASDWGSMVRNNMIALADGSYAAIWAAGAIASFTIAINLIVDDISAKSGGSLAKKMV